MTRRRLKDDSEMMKRILQAEQTLSDLGITIIGNNIALSVKSSIDNINHVFVIGDCPAVSCEFPREVDDSFYLQ